MSSCLLLGLASTSVWKKCVHLLRCKPTTTRLYETTRIDLSRRICQPMSWLAVRWRNLCPTTERTRAGRRVAPMGRIGPAGGISARPLAGRSASCVTVWRRR